MNKLQVIVFLPAFNEEESIGNVIRNIPRDFHDKVDVKVLVIDDGSSDRTVEVSTLSGADYIVSFPKNQGLGAAVVPGYVSALKGGRHWGDDRRGW